ncbi:MAG: Adaptive-response sensory-kinase SasA [Chroococcidiopsis sp. SAG 2025]|uniref:ATP-binding protein n=1 Tax=Chroococcidiopsis sp. SAG 2025 TaxID=171389 RepID=UPI002936E1BD|nr:ATP-binding protein [Chroococcidiopsis sp. SAG 2025]MDV2992970.1 Adaptive-response sensory-kinase SasA [Chroococcidiopsis sp. SAG 2025]
MVPVNFKKIATKKEVVALLEYLKQETGTAIQIHDADGKRIVGVGSENSTHRYPIEFADRVIGWIAGSEKAIAIVNLISYLLKQEFEKKALANELLEKYRELTLLHDITTQITASLELKEVAQLVIEGVGKLIEATGGSISLLNQKTGELESLSSVGQAFPPQESLKLGGGLIGRIADTGKGEIVNDITADPRFGEYQGPIKSLICVPLKTKEQMNGVIFFWSQEVDELSERTALSYNSEDLKILTMFAFHAAVAIEKALLYEQSCISATVAQAQAQQLQQALYELQHTQAHLIQSEKMSSLGQLVAGIAHEIDSPVNFIHGNLAYISNYAQNLLNLIELYQKYHPSDRVQIQELMANIDLEFLLEDLPKTLNSMKVDVGRIRKIALSLRDFSRSDELEMKPIDINEGIDSTLLILDSRLKAISKHSGIRIVREYGKLPLIDCYSSQINQVFMSILANAIDAVENQSEAGAITIRTEVMEVENESSLALGMWQLEDKFTTHSSFSFSSPHVVIRIQDNGAGISEEVRDRIFEPFFTTKTAGNGAGLGLSISHQIVEKHGGVLKCFSEPGHGATFCIQIPIKQTMMLQPIFSSANGNKVFNSELSLAGII